MENAIARFSSQICPVSSMSGDDTERGVHVKMAGSPVQDLVEVREQVGDDRNTSSTKNPLLVCEISSLFCQLEREKNWHTHRPPFLVSYPSLARFSCYYMNRE